MKAFWRWHWCQDLPVASRVTDGWLRDQRKRLSVAAIRSAMVVANSELIVRFGPKAALAQGEDDETSYVITYRIICIMELNH